MPGWRGTLGQRVVLHFVVPAVSLAVLVFQLCRDRAAAARAAV
jgi:hypothetical protein